MRKVKYKIKAHNLIFIYVVTTIIVTTISLSRYVTTVSSNSMTKVALMAEDVAVDIDLTEGIYPGYEKVCPVTITNKDENRKYM